VGSRCIFSSTAPAAILNSLLAVFFDDLAPIFSGLSAGRVTSLVKAVELRHRR
jgi:hypothetical protein